MLESGVNLNRVSAVYVKLKGKALIPGYFILDIYMFSNTLARHTKRVMFGARNHPIGFKKQLLFVKMGHGQHIAGPSSLCRKLHLLPS